MNFDIEDRANTTVINSFISKFIKSEELNKHFNYIFSISTRCININTERHTMILSNDDVDLQSFSKYLLEGYKNASTILDYTDKSGLTVNLFASTNETFCMNKDFYYYKNSEEEPNVNQIFPMIKENTDLENSIY